MAIEKDITIPKEIFKLFPNAVRITDKRSSIGMWPVDPSKIGKLRTVVPEIFENETIKKKFDIAVGYNGKSMKTDFAKIGIDVMPDRIINNIMLHGIPVPWTYLRKAGIDNKKFNMFLIPNM
jgi:hypothetical protein